MSKFGMVLIVIGQLIMGLAVISGVGYGLYLWGAQSMELGPSAWEGFVVFLKLIGGGLVTALLGIGLFALGES